VKRPRNLAESVDLLGVAGGVHRGESAADAVSDDVDRRPAGAVPDRVDAVVDVPVDVVVHPQVLVQPGRFVPVDHVDVVSVLEESADDAPVGLEVENVRPVDQRPHDEQRGGVLLVGQRLVVEQFQLVLPVDDLRGRFPDPDVLHLREVLGH
jgi:hypothetical protein